MSLSWYENHLTSWPSAGPTGVSVGTCQGLSDTLAGASSGDLRVLSRPTSWLWRPSRAYANGQEFPPLLVGRTWDRSRRRRTVPERWRECSKRHRWLCWSSPPFGVWKCWSTTGSIVSPLSPNEEIQSYRDLGREEKTALPSFALKDVCLCARWILMNWNRVASC